MSKSRRAFPAVGTILGWLIIATDGAGAATLKCKIEESNIVLQLDVGGPTTDVHVGTLSSAAKLRFKAVPVQSENGAFVISAGPAHAVTISGTGCHELQSSYVLRLEELDGTTNYKGDLQIIPGFSWRKNAPKTCPRFAAPEIYEETHRDVRCLTSGS